MPCRCFSTRCCNVCCQFLPKGWSCFWSQHRPSEKCASYSNSTAYLAFRDQLFPTYSVPSDQHKWLLCEYEQSCSCCQKCANACRDILRHLLRFKVFLQDEVVTLQNPADVPVYIQVLPLALMPNPSVFSGKLAERWDFATTAAPSSFLSFLPFADDDLFLISQIAIRKFVQHQHWH